METTLENRPDINPFAAPLASATVKDQGNEYRTRKRASQGKLQNINCMAIVSDLSFVACWCCFLVPLFAPVQWTLELHAWATMAYWIALFLFWFSTTVGLFRTGSHGALITPLLLPIPVIGFLAYLLAKQGMQEFMIKNGYRRCFLGFVADEAQRNAMEQDPDYAPSLKFHLDGSKRAYIFSLGECWFLLGALCLAGWTAYSVIVTFYLR